MLLSKTFQFLTNLIQNIDKFRIRYQDCYSKTTNKFRINLIEEINIKSDAKKMKVIKYKLSLLFFILVSFFKNVI